MGGARATRTRRPARHRCLMAPADHQLAQRYRECGLRKLIHQGEAREYVADPLNGDAQRFMRSGRKDRSAVVFHSVRQVIEMLSIHAAP